MGGNMRKIILSLLIVFGIIFLTGCDSNRETVDILLNNLLIYNRFINLYYIWYYNMIFK